MAQQSDASDLLGEQIPTPDRPKVTQEMIADAAAKMAKENGWNDKQASDLAKHFRHHMDGYELAKELESRCYWDISDSDVETLGSMGVDVREIHRKVCMAWARDNAIQPPIPVGTMTTRGEITGISEYDAACYLVRRNGESDPTRREIVRFEDARAVDVWAVGAA